MLGTTQYFRVTAVSGCLADVLRADVNPLFMSIPGGDPFLPQTEDWFCECAEATV